MLPWVNSNAKDMFGYYNGQIGNASLIPTQTLVFAMEQYTVGAGDRSVYPDSMQAGILKSIYYPTGGHSSFTYEPNSYNSQNTATALMTFDARATGTLQQTDTATFSPSIQVQAQVTVNISPYNFTDVHTPPSVSMIDLTNGQTPYSTGTTDASVGLSQTTTVLLQAGHNYRLTAGAYDDGHVYSNITVNWQQVDSSITSLYGGGLRIKQISDYDVNNRFLKSDYYAYGVGECGYGNLAGPVQLLNTNSYVRNFTYYNGAVACNPYSFAVQRMIFTGSSVYDIFTLAGAPVTYPQVTKYQVDSLNNNIGKTIYTYSNYSNTVMPAMQSYVDGFCILNTGWQGGQLLSEELFANKGGSYWPVKRTFNSYIDSMPQQGRGLKVGYTAVFPGTPPMDSADIVLGCWPMYYYYDYPIYAGSVLLAGSSIYDYDQNDTTSYVITTRQYSYDNLNHLQPTTIQSNTSDGSALLTINRYPAEVDSIAGLSAGEIAAIDSLQSRHNVATLLQSQTFRNSSPVKLLRYDYAVWPNNMVLQDSVEWQEGTYPIDKRLQFYQYDANGNILQDSKSSDVNYSFIWDYNKAYPIAEVSNAAQSDVAYTSFEADGGGNWSVTSPTRDPAYALTGNQSYNLSNGACSKAGLASSTTYIVSYWSRGGSYSVTGSTGILQGKTINGWTYYEHTVTGATMVSVTGAADIDELRLYPQTAQMKTYTYSPLVGLTSQCDVQNRVTYYSYDGIGRLRYIKDQDGNIVKTFEYHYQGQ
jgi:YD repeat-containing protein